MSNCTFHENSTHFCCFSQENNHIYLHLITTQDVNSCSPSKPTKSFKCRKSERFIELTDLQTVCDVDTQTEEIIDKNDKKETPNPREVNDKVIDKKETHSTSLIALYKYDSSNPCAHSKASCCDLCCSGVPDGKSYCCESCVQSYKLVNVCYKKKKEPKPIKDKPIEEKPIEEKPIKDKPVKDKPIEDIPRRLCIERRKPTESTRRDTNERRRKDTLETTRRESTDSSRRQSTDSSKRESNANTRRESNANTRRESNGNTRRESNGNTRRESNGSTRRESNASSRKKQNDNPLMCCCRCFNSKDKKPKSNGNEENKQRRPSNDMCPECNCCKKDNCYGRTEEQPDLEESESSFELHCRPVNKYGVNGFDRL